MIAIPAELTCKQLATLMAMPFETIRNRMRRGVIPTIRMGGKRVVLISKLQTDFPELYDAILLRARMMREDDEDE